jgi:hypothetical protein
MRGNWIFQLAETLQLHYGPGFDPASNRNEGKGRPSHKADSLTTICEPIV